MTLVVAHRGASALHPPGNTPEALAASQPQGADWVELDVHATADGGLAVHHDHDLADGRDLSDIASADLPEFVPTLDRALELCAPLGVNVEIKADGPVELRESLIVGVTELLRDRGEPSRWLVTSFDHDICDRVRELAPEIPTGLLTFDDAAVEDLIERARGGGHVAINPWDAIVDPSIIDRAHDVGLAVNVWTVDDPERMGELVALGVDAIITNRPDVCRTVVESFGR